MNARLTVAVLLLLLACGLQFWLGSAGIFINFILAALIVCAFFFTFVELLIFILFAVFVVNWAPAPSLAILLFAFIPVVAYFFRRWFNWTPWVGVPVVIVCGFALLYAAVAPSLLWAAPASVMLDVLGGLLFGELAFWAIEKAER